MLWGRGIVFSMLWCLLALRLLLANSCLVSRFRMLIFLFYTVAYGSIRDDKEKTENQWKNYLVSLRFPSRFHTQLAVPWFSFKPFCFSIFRTAVDRLTEKSVGRLLLKAGVWFRSFHLWILDRFYHMPREDYWDVDDRTYTCSDTCNSVILQV